MTMLAWPLLVARVLPNILPLINNLDRNPCSPYVHCTALHYVLDQLWHCTVSGLNCAVCSEEGQCVNYISKERHIAS